MAGEALFNNPQKTKFKNDTGQFLIKALFWETNNDTPDQILYTLKDEDYRGFPSLRRLFLEMEDETEYLFAIRYFYSFEHWNRIAGSNQIRPFIRVWREELRLQVLNKALARIRSIAEGDGKDKLSAQRYLIEKSWDKKTTRRVGRPDKELPKEDQPSLNRTFNEDMLRIGLAN